MASSAPLIVELAELRSTDAGWAGSKAVRLGALTRAGFMVPEGVCISTVAYEQFLRETGLGSRIQILLQRKRFEDMRWEELWDLALRIRSLFLRTPVPDALANRLREPLANAFDHQPVVVRSAAIGEDSGQASFAGLHDSFVDVRGAEAIVDYIKRVWASLWSDRALLYRKELGLAPTKSAIAVVVQRLALGRASGVLFTQSPIEPDEGIIEAVWGLNQGLVDGTVAPDRWHLDRPTGELLRHLPAERTHALRLGAIEPSLQPLGAVEQDAAPLAADDVQRLWTLGQRLEERFGAPQDVEWTVVDGEPILLQTRPITTQAGAEGDPRRWYLTLHRSLDSLRRLRSTIEEQVLPGMASEAERLAAVDLGALDEAALADEILRRQAISQGWIDTYWRECIPFAHGVRLFGQIYNDHVAPADPFEFIELLEDTQLLAQQRNAELEQIAARWRERDQPGVSLETLEAALDRFMERHGATLGLDGKATRDGIERLVEQLGQRPADSRRARVRSGPALRAAFLERFGGDERDSMAELLELARASYRLRDDDNIYLGRVDGELRRAVELARSHIAERGVALPSEIDAAAIVHALEDPSYQPAPPSTPSEDQPRFELRARQLVGQPASPGLCTGPARVVRSKQELFRVERGDVLICDSLDPTMTLVAPLVAAIVERRGGMLIHGAIIAREYGVPCVTGVPDVLSWIADGDRITVDGYVGLVTIGSASTFSGGGPRGAPQGSATGAPAEGPGRW